ncbi:MAG: radical SAM protein [Proteobacteria bacterium]|nr:radical SAM protein [Pseudomonadota bacterium]
MPSDSNRTENYTGFEQGPIRPPSEAASLLLRLTRNCPWNRCTFCPVYKNSSFTLRPINHIIKDIQTVSRHVDRLRAAQKGDVIPRSELSMLLDQTEAGDMEAFHAAITWVQNGMHSIFLQDANSLILKPSDLIIILDQIKSCFPWVQRITSYARSHTVSRISDEDLIKIRQAGLSRIHIGMESGSDKVLEKIKKGCTKAMHIKAGIKVKQAGMELSEYVIPGLGGVELSTEHALETADALNRINPDFIRLRTLAIPGHVELYEDYQSGRFDKASDVLVAKEILLLLEHLEGITSTVKSDHILNLFQDIEGCYPKDKERMTGIIRSFLVLSPEDQMLVQVGRRMGMLRSEEDQANPDKMNHIRQTCAAHGITPDTVNEVIDDIMRRFI